MSDLTCFNRTKRFGKYTHQEAKIDTDTETKDPMKMNRWMTEYNNKKTNENDAQSVPHMKF